MRPYDEAYGLFFSYGGDTALKGDDVTGRLGGGGGKAVKKVSGAKHSQNKTHDGRTTSNGEGFADQITGLGTGCEHCLLPRKS